MWGCVKFILLGLAFFFIQATAFNNTRAALKGSVVVVTCQALREALKETEVSVVVVTDCITCSSHSWGGAKLTVERNVTVVGNTKCALRWLLSSTVIKVQDNFRLKFENLTITLAGLENCDHPPFLQVEGNGSVEFQNVMLGQDQSVEEESFEDEVKSIQHDHHTISFCNKSTKYKEEIGNGGRRLKLKESQESGKTDEGQESKNEDLLKIVLLLAGVAVLVTILLCVICSMTKRLTFQRSKACLLESRESRSGRCITAESISNPQREQTSFLIDNARFEFQIGKGEHGCVYKASYEGETLAIKVILANDLNPRASLEARLAQNALHPNVVRSYCTLSRGSIDWRDPLEVCDDASESTSRSGSLDDFIYSTTQSVPRRNTWLIVMEFCNLGNLKDLLKNAEVQAKLRGRAKSQTAFLRKIALDISRGMYYLHCKDILHGDLKPQNILLQNCPSDPFGFVAKVGDFGLSRHMTNTAFVQTKTCGSVRYMSPELLREGLLSMKTDVYSFGMVLWEMVLGTEPYFGKSEVEVMLMVSEGRRPHSLGSVTGELGVLMRLCLQQDYTTRPGFGHIVAALEGHWRNLSPIPRRAALKS